LRGFNLFPAAAAISASISWTSSSAFHTVLPKGGYENSTAEVKDPLGATLLSSSAAARLAGAEQAAPRMPLAVPGSTWEQRWAVGSPTASLGLLCGSPHSHTPVPRGPAACRGGWQGQKGPGDGGEASA